VQQDDALAWDDKEVATRWLKLFGGKPLVRSFVAGENISEAQLSAVSSMIERYRERLFSISWFMRCLNEPIARQANAEDNVTGRFWEGRFKSQALLDEASVIAAMAYVDLNPIRAAMAETPEGFTADSHLFFVYVAQNDFDRAFQWIEDAIEKNSSLLLLRFPDPLAKSLRSDDRYRVLHEKIYGKRVSNAANTEKTPVVDRGQ
jgi:hypothetical protein